MGPEAAAPSILDYRPRSTLMGRRRTWSRRPATPRSIFMATRKELLGSVESLARLGAALDSLNVRMMIVANNVSGDALQADGRDDQRVAGDEGPRSRARGHQLPERGTRLGAEGGRAARGRRRRRRGGRGRDRKGLRAVDPQAGWLAAQARRPRARSHLGRVRAAQASGVHPHGRSAGVLPADRLHQRALARAVAVPRAPRIRRTGFRASRS